VYKVKYIFKTSQYWGLDVQNRGTTRKTP